MSEDIVPDTKSWTWVLERRCEDCGFDSSSFDARRTGAAVRDLGIRWTEVLNRPDATMRSRPDMWSALEYGCHVRDVFRLFDMRLGLMLNETDPNFPSWNQDQTAIEDGYAHQDPAIVSHQLNEAAHALADSFDALGSNDWDRRGFRSDGTAFTVKTLGQYLMHDPVHHLWDVNAEVPTYS